ncbi:hypothetical protein LJG64_31875, partial [Pseudomonas aeruginosa]|nr:hypothetical protein [Pseudomonas aeruginosa]
AFDQIATGRAGIAAILTALIAGGRGAAVTDIVTASRGNYGRVRALGREQFAFLTLLGRRLTNTSGGIVGIISIGTLIPLSKKLPASAVITSINNTRVSTRNIHNRTI